MRRSFFCESSTHSRAGCSHPLGKRQRCLKRDLAEPTGLLLAGERRKTAETAAMEAYCLRSSCLRNSGPSMATLETGTPRSTRSSSGSSSPADMTTGRPSWCAATGSWSALRGRTSSRTPGGTRSTLTWRPRSGWRSRSGRRERRWSGRPPRPRQCRAQLRRRLGLTGTRRRRSRPGGCSRRKRCPSGARRRGCRQSERPKRRSVGRRLR
mmetsp:Transcript_14975/g.35700  ORF Transcript_14975/g.35700 Transcript_14975/m.35700 type:complete len:210 (+) Transcript_14975:635-1264(+)